MSITAIVRRHRTRVVVAALALVVAGTGVVAAATAGLNTVVGSSVRNESLTGLDVKNSSLFSSDIKDGGLLGIDLKADTITGREVSERTLLVPANISQTLTATDVANTAAGDALAETLLLSRGDLSVTATCWRQTDTNTLHLDVQVRSAVNGAMLTSPLDDRSGGTAAASFLNIDTAKLDRQVHSPNVAANTFRLNEGGEFTAWSPGGDYMRGTIGSVLQNGTVAGVTPPLGDGTKCQVVGYISAVAV
jgi:hypothetical protein